MTDSRNVADFLGEDGCLRCGVVLCQEKVQVKREQSIKPSLSQGILSVNDKDDSLRNAHH